MKMNEEKKEFGQGIDIEAAVKEQEAKAQTVTEEKPEIVVDVPEIQVEPKEKKPMNKFVKIGLWTLGAVAVVGTIALIVKKCQSGDTSVPEVPAIPDEVADVIE